MRTYDLRENLDGSWSVYETAAGIPVILNGMPQVALHLAAAQKVVDDLTSFWIAPLQCGASALAAAAGL